MVRRHAGERGSDAAQVWTHYQMRQNLVSIGDDFWIENDQREKMFKVDGKALRVRQTLIFEDPHGQERAPAAGAVVHEPPVPVRALALPLADPGHLCPPTRERRLGWSDTSLRLRGGKPPSAGAAAEPGCMPSHAAPPPR